MPGSPSYWPPLCDLDKALFTPDPTSLSLRNRFSPLIAAFLIATMLGISCICGGAVERSIEHPIMFNVVHAWARWAAPKVRVHVGLEIDFPRSLRMWEALRSL